MLVLKNCRLVLELTPGYQEEYADIILDGKLIREILPVGSDGYAEAEAIDLGGKTVLPGFFDLHAHLMFKDQDYYASMARPQNKYLIDCIEHAQVYLQHGYTTIRDCGNDFYAGVAVRDAVESGIVEGARIITSGKIISPVAKGNSSFGTLYWEVDDPREMMHIVRTEVAEGVDFIKYMSTGAVLNEGGVPGECITTAEELEAITAAAKTLGTYVAAHCHGTEGIKLSIKNGVRTIEHASYMDRECVDLMLQREDLVATVPTISIAYTLVKELYEGGVLPEFVAKSKDACVHMMKGIEMCEEAGLLVGWGTDLDMMMFKRYPGLEFLGRAEYGIDNLTLLRQATINSAKIVGLEDRCGTVEVGKYADLAVIDGNPDQDMSVMGKLPVYVFKEGKLVSCTK
ncbi:MAG: amidohydrolase family protein [Mogibacterium sp.]|nr:amidohydrolase family protein [Mogibacterium sp.]